MTFEMKIQLAPAAYRHDSDPGTVCAIAPDRSALGLFDGSGSWGHGVEAAAWTRARVAERWRDDPPQTIEEAIADVGNTTRTLPARFGENDGDCAFCGVAIVLRGAVAAVAAAGLFTVALADEARVRTIFRPNMLTDQLIFEGKLRPQEAPDFVHQGVCLGPYLADGKATALAHCGAHEIPPGSVLIVAHSRVMKHLLGQPPEVWLWEPAERLQVAGDLAPWPLIVIRNEYPVHDGSAERGG